MSVLTLVRHGQASYLSADYDRLSPLGELQSRKLGELQSRKLGEFWARRGIRFDRVYCGPAQRHRRTCEIAAEALRQAGGSVPDPVIVDDVDEFDAATVLRRLVPVLVDRDQEVARLYREFRASEDSPEAGRLLQKLFEVVARHWASGEFDIPEVESWENFRGRVSRAIACIRANAPKSSNSVVFTSGGPIAATISLALDLAPRDALELIWVSRNGSYSEFLFSGERFSLSSYNSFPHLDERELLTYR